MGGHRNGGPVPKRDDERRRRNKDVVETEKIKTPDELPAMPPADESWHPVARGWYESLARSAQSIFYEASDWSTAYLIAESLSRDLAPQVIGMHPETGRPVRASIPIKGSNLTAYLKGMTSLLVTEGDRRRSRIEIEREAAEAAKRPVSSLDRRRGRLAA